MREEIIITVQEDGQIEAEVKGVKGKRCIELTEFISDLGDSARTLKGDYFQSSKTRVDPHLSVHNRQENSKEPA